MKIALDMDDILVRLLERFVDFHNDNYGTSVALEQFDTYNFEVILGGTREEMAEKITTFLNSEDCINIKPVDGAQEGIEMLSKEHELVVVTARPHFAKEQTVKCLNLLYPGKFSSVNLTNQWHGKGERRKKSEVCKELKVEAIAEDSLKHATDCAENGIRVALLNRPWNQSKELHPLITRVNSWEEIPNVLLKE